MLLATFTPTHLSRLLLTLLAYVALGALSLGLSYHVDHVSPFYLSTGVALVAMLVWGYAMWPAVALGCAAMTPLAHLFDHTSVPLMVWVQSVAQGLGGAAQAALGAMLVRRFVSQPLTLEEPRDILSFFALAGPLACVLNASVAALFVHFAGAMPGASAGNIFLTWWCGDTMGVLIAAPIMLTFIGQPRLAWLGRRWTVAMPLAMLTLLMVLALLQVREWDAQRQRNVFERDANVAFNELRLRLLRYTDAIEALHDVYVASQEVTRDEFRRAVAGWLPELRGLQALTWAEPLKAVDRQSFEARQQAEGVPGYRIFAAPNRGEPHGSDWLVVRFAEPRPLARTVLGMDVQTLPGLFEAARRSQLTGRVAVSQPYRLFILPEREYGVALARVVFNETTGEARGYLFAVLRVDDVMHELMKSVPDYMDACLLDIDAQRSGDHAHLINTASCADHTFDRAMVRHAIDLPLMGRTWQLQLWTRDRVPLAIEGYHWLLGAVGMALSAALGLLLLAITGRARRIEVAVKDRTARLEFEISERHHTEQALRESEQRLRAIFDGVPIGVVYTDLDGSIRQANPGFCALTGYAEADLVGMSLQTLAHPEDRSAGQSLREQMLGHEQTVITQRLRYLTRGGRTRLVHLSMRLLQDGAARPLGVVGVVEDITERMRLQDAERAREAAEASNRAKSEFLSRMSHELRTPLNAMLGFAQLLDLDQQTPLAVQHKSWVSEIQRAGWHLLEMINDVLDLSRIDAGTFRMELRSLDVEDLVDSARQLVDTQAQRRKITLNCSREDLAVPPVLADATRARQILSNLLSNAVKYNREGGSISVRAHVRPDQRVSIDIADTGMGMSPAQLRELFQPFNRLGRERSSVEGTGIGLVISKRLVELMNGTLDVHSEVGKGSTFSLILPLAPVEPVGAEAAPPAGTETTAPTAGYHRRRVVYIEDNEANANVMAGVFAQRPQVSLEICRSAIEGLDAIARERPDLLLLDMHLPDFSGMDVLLRLKSDPNTASIPVVVVSADVVADQIQEALGAGALDYLTKPLQVAEALKVIDDLLDRVTTVS